MKRGTKDIIMASLLLGMAGMGSAENSNSLKPKDINVTPKEPPIPKGCKEYFFDIDGNFSTERMLKSECVFKCVASNDNNAKRKFEKYKLRSL